MDRPARLDRSDRAVSFTPPPAFTTRPTLAGTFGMSASTHWIATASAQSVLERGGNAFDAATAGAFVLHVVEPHLNGPGGDLVGVFATADDPTPVVLMGQGPAPARASIAHYTAEGLDLVPGAGGLAAAVPGAVDAWLVLLRDHGTWELSEVLAYAIGYARDGHPLVAQAAATIARVAELFRDDWKSSADLWMPAGAPPRAGEVVRNPAYASVLEGLVHAAGSLREEGPGGRAARIDAARREWREGFVAAEATAFLRAPHRHSGGGMHSAVIEASDFAAFEAGYEPALTRDFRGVTIAIGVGCFCHLCMCNRIIQQALRLSDDLIGFCANEFKRTRFDSFRAFGGLAQDQNGDAKRGGLFLEATRIGDEEFCMLHQMHHRAILQWM